MASRDVRDRAEAKSLAFEYFPSFLRSREHALKINAWMRGNQYRASEDMDVADPFYGRAYAPARAETTLEYDNIRSLSSNNFASLVVSAVAQVSHMKGISRSGSTDTLKIWETFQRNQWTSRQHPIHRAAIGHGVAYGVVVPGEDPLSGSPLARMRGKAATRMAAFYDDDDDEWAEFAIEATKSFKSRSIERIQEGWDVKLWNKRGIHILKCKGDGETLDDWTYIERIDHFMRVTPIARLANQIDLDGHTIGEIEPVLPILRRIDQDLFDRLIKQRFGAWKVRYIAGMAKPKASDEQATKMRLAIDDLLVSTDKETKFGTLDADDLKGQIEATDADLRLLSAISQTPPHHLLGLSSNLQAEALAAAEAGLKRKSFLFRTNAADFHSQMARLAAMAENDRETAGAWDLSVSWMPDETQSMIQAAQSMAVFADQVHVPLEMVWEMMPGWTDSDVERAKRLVEDGSIDALIQELLNDTEATGGNPNPSPAAAE